jgi:TolB-like protein
MEAAPGTAGPVRFGRFELDMRARELRSGTLVVRLQDQPFEILCTMLERPGDVVTREELRRRLWPDGTYVDFEHSLNAAVKRLRAALGDDAENPSFVETLPRRGYRFIASLSAAAVDHGGARTSASRGKTRVAVLPFRDLGDERHEYFADGLTEELIAQLGGVGRNQIAVVARWSSMVFKNTGLRIRDIGEALRADYLLEGSVRREGERIRVTAHLVAAADEVQLWSESYDRHMTDVLAVQSDVAARIARSLAAELMPAEIHRVAPACDPAAYQTYLKGRYYWNKRADEGLDQALASRWLSRRRMGRPTPPWREPGCRRPSITATCRSARSAPLRRLPPGRWRSTIGCTRRTSRWPMRGACSTGIGMARATPIGSPSH